MFYVINWSTQRKCGTVKVLADNEAMAIGIAYMHCAVSANGKRFNSFRVESILEVKE